MSYLPSTSTSSSTSSNSYSAYSGLRLSQLSRSRPMRKLASPPIPNVVEEVTIHDDEDTSDDDSNEENNEYMRLTKAIQNIILETDMFLTSLESHRRNRTSVYADELCSKMKIECIQMKQKSMKSHMDKLLQYLQKEHGYEGFICCPICLETYDRASKMPKRFNDCSHCICKQCLTNWNRINQHCPICRNKNCSTSDIFF